MAQGENVLANMENVTITDFLLCAFFLHSFRKIIEDNEIMKNALEVCMLAPLSAENEKYGRLTNVVRNIRQLKRAGGVTLDSKYAYLISLLLCVS